MLNNKVYDILNIIVRYILPGLSALYCALATIWGFPGTEQVVGTIAAVNTFLGVLLGISSKKYNEAQNVETESEEVITEESTVEE